MISNVIFFSLAILYSSSGKTVEFSFPPGSDAPITGGSPPTNGIKWQQQQLSKNWLGKYATVKKLQAYPQVISQNRPAPCRHTH